MKRLPLLLVALVGAILLGLAVGLPRPAHPPFSSENALPAATSSLPSLSLASSALAATGGQVAWNPSQLVVTLSPGEIQSVLATATISRLVPAATVQVDAALRPYVSSTPSQLHALPHGGAQNFQLSVTVPSSTPFQTVSGTLALHLRAGDQGVTDTLPITVNVWPVVTSGDVKLNYPPGWVARQTPGTITLTNVQPAPLSDAALETQTFFELRLRTSAPGVTTPSHANPSLLPIDQWFNQYFHGFPVEPQSRTPLLVNGHPAIRLEAEEFGGVRAHVFISKGPDVIEVSYGLFAPQFIPLYEAILNSSTF